MTDQIDYEGLLPDSNKESAPEPAKNTPDLLNVHKSDHEYGSSKLPYLDYLGKIISNLNDDPSSLKIDWGDSSEKEEANANISTSFLRILEQINFDRISSSPLFISWRTGYSDDIIYLVLLPWIRKISGKHIVVVPFQRFATSLDQLGVAQTRNYSDLNPTGHAGAEALSELINSLPGNYRQYIRNRFTTNEPFEFTYENVIHSPGSISENDHSYLEKKVHDITLKHTTPFFGIDEFLILYDALNQDQAITIIKRVFDQIDGAPGPVIILLELFGVLETQLAATIRKVLADGTRQGIYLWLHGEIESFPQELLSQFQNQIIILPTQSELRKLKEIHPIEEEEKSSLNSFLICGPCIKQTRSWKTFPLDSNEKGNWKSPAEVKFPLKRAKDYINLNFNIKGRNISIDADNGISNDGKVKGTIGSLRKASIHFIDYPDSEKAKKLGTDLFNFIFSDNRIRDSFISLTSSAQTKGLRLRFHFSDYTLNELPWELLFDPISNNYLSLTTKFSIVRYPRLPESEKTIHPSLPLRVLVIISDPGQNIVLASEQNGDVRPE